MGKEKVCLNCGNELPKRNKTFCSGKCQVDFKKEKNKSLDHIKGLEKSSAPRNYEIKITLSRLEKANLKKKAEEVGLKISQFGRVVVINASINPKIPELIFL